MFKVYTLSFLFIFERKDVLAMPKVFKVERDYQSYLVKKLSSLFPGSFVIPMDGNYIQGFPDILILFMNKWAALECKRTASEPHRPNQDYYVERLNNMSFSSFIFPENEEEVLHELQQSFQSGR